MCHVSSTLFRIKADNRAMHMQAVRMQVRTQNTTCGRDASSREMRVNAELQGRQQGRQRERVVAACVTCAACCSVSKLTTVRCTCKLCECRYEHRTHNSLHVGGLSLSLVCYTSTLLGRSCCNHVWFYFKCIFLHRPAFVCSRAPRNPFETSVYVGRASTVATQSFNFQRAVICNTNLLLLQSAMADSSKTLSCRPPRSSKRPVLRKLRSVEPSSPVPHGASLLRPKSKAKPEMVLPAEPWPAMQAASKVPRALDAGLSECRPDSEVKPARNKSLTLSEAQAALQVPLGKKLKRMPADGSCFFHCVIEALQLPTNVAALRDLVQCPGSTWADRGQIQQVADHLHAQFTLYHVDLMYMHEAFQPGPCGATCETVQPATSDPGFLSNVEVILWTVNRDGYHFDLLVTDPERFNEVQAVSSADDVSMPDAPITDEDSTGSDVPIATAEQTFQVSDPSIAGAASETLLPDGFGDDRVEKDARTLLQLWDEKRAWWDFLSSLPLFVHGMSLSAAAATFEVAVENLIGDRVNAAAAAQVRCLAADAVVYPLAVLICATARATGASSTFYMDMFHTLLNSILNPKFSLRLGRWGESRSRHWMVGTANVGEGKSPSMKALVRILQEVLREHSDLAPGVAADRFHMQQSSTTTAAVDKLRDCQGSLTLYCSDAGRCLDARAATGGKTDHSQYVDLLRFLDTAHGDEFEHSTKHDRTAMRKVVPAAGPGPLPASQNLAAESHERAHHDAAATVLVPSVLGAHDCGTSCWTGSAVPALFRGRPGSCNERV